MKSNMMKRACKLSAFGCLLVAMSSQAGLINRGNGMIYDDVLDVTWLQDANYAHTSGFDTDGLVTFETAESWVSSLSFSGYDDWRLPKITPLNGATFDFGFSFDGSTDRGFNQATAGNELAYMFHENLNNTSYFNELGVSGQPGSESFNSSFVDGATGELFSFSNVAISYWYDLANDPIFNAAWGYNMRVFSGFATGETQLLSTNAELSVWALRDGDVADMTDPGPVDPVPQVSTPATFGLFITALLGGVLSFRRR